MREKEKKIFNVYAFLGKILRAEKQYIIWNGKRLQCGWLFVIDPTDETTFCYIGKGKPGRETTVRFDFVNEDGDYVQPKAVILESFDKNANAKVREKELIIEHGRFLDPDEQGTLANLKLGDIAPCDTIQSELNKAKRNHKNNPAKREGLQKQRKSKQRQIIICDFDKTILDRGSISEMNAAYPGINLCQLVRKRNKRVKAWCHKLDQYIWACYEEDYETFVPEPGQKRTPPKST